MDQSGQQYLADRYETYERLEAWERNGSLRGPWRRRESIFVGVATSGNAERLIRRGFRIAYRLKADWHVVYVHTGETISDALQMRVNTMQDLTVRVGGKFEVDFVSSRHQVQGCYIMY